jgi:hypothetical protein
VESYVLADDFCKTEVPPARGPGPAAARDRAAGLTLAIFGQWSQLPAAAACFRWATTPRRPLVPTRPSRPQFNRMLRRAPAALTACARARGQGVTGDDDDPDEAIDGTGRPPHHAKRRGAGGRAGGADIGQCPRLGWDVVRGVGKPVRDREGADRGGSGKACQARGATADGASVVRAPPTGSTRAWATPWKTWLAGLRQVMEPVNDRLRASRGVAHARPHARRGRRGGRPRSGATGSTANGTGRTWPSPT